MPAVEEKIKKLLAIADSASGTPEGITASKIALKLMQAHAVDVDALEEDESITYRTLPLDQAKWPLWRRNLAEVVAQHCSCRSLLVGPDLRIYGHRHDLDVAVYLLSLLETQITAEAWVYVRRKPSHTYSDVDRFLRSAVLRIHERLAAVRDDSDETDEAEAGTALMRVRADAVDRHIHKHHVVADRTTTVDASREGYNAGGRVRLGHTEVSGG